MKKILLSLFIHLFVPYYVFAGGVLFMAGGVDSGGGGLVHELSLDDNAASTVVVNNGTEGDWASSVNTSGVHSATFIEGTGSFNYTNDNDYSVSPNNWTSEKFEIQFWSRFESVDSYNESHWQIGDGSYSIEANEIMLRRLSGNSNWHIFTNDGSEKSIATTDFSPSINTWYRTKMNINTTTSGWVVSMAYSTNGVDYTDLTMGSWDTSPNVITLNAKMWIGSDSAVDPRAMFDYFTAEDLQ